MFIIDPYVLSLINFRCHMADNSMTSTCYTVHHGHMGLSTVSSRSFCSERAGWLTLPWPKRCFFSWRWGPEIEPSSENMPCMSEHNVLSPFLPLFVPSFQKYSSSQACQQRRYRHPPGNKHTPCVCCSLSNLNSTAGISNSRSLQLTTYGWATKFIWEISLNSKLIQQNHDLLVKSEMGKKGGLVSIFFGAFFPVTDT